MGETFGPNIKLEISMSIDIKALESNNRARTSNGRGILKNTNPLSNIPAETSDAICQTIGGMSDFEEPPATPYNTPLPLTPRPNRNVPQKYNSLAEKIAARKNSLRSTNPVRKIFVEDHSSEEGNDLFSPENRDEVKVPDRPNALSSVD